MSGVLLGGGKFKTNFAIARSQYCGFLTVFPFAGSFTMPFRSCPCMYFQIVHAFFSLFRRLNCEEAAEIDRELDSSDRSVN